MRSVRLPKDLERKLESIAEQKNVSRSEIIKEALVAYMAQEEKVNNPHALGKELFGKYGSGEKDRSQTYKERLKSKINEKHSH